MPPMRCGQSRANLPILMFAMGIIGTGLLAIPVLAGSAAYAVAEVLRMAFHRWRPGFPEAIGFYAIIARRDGRSDSRLDSSPRSIPFSMLDLDRCHQRNRRRPHHGGDDADRDKQQGDGSFSGASNARLGRLGRNGFDGRHCRSIIVVATALGSTTSLTASCQSPT